MVPRRDAERQGGGRADANDEGVSIYDYMATHTPREQKLGALAAASQRLAHDFGTWRTPWGEINRFQRLTDDIVPHFTDAGPSIPVGLGKFRFYSSGRLAIWGSWFRHCSSIFPRSFGIFSRVLAFPIARAKASAAPPTGTPRLLEPGRP